MPSDPFNEKERLKTLQAYRIMDTSPDPNLDRITQLAATICRTPMALISLVDDRRQWFKSSVGVEVKETPRCDAFCLQVIQNCDFYLIEDATASEMFANNPLVTGGFGLRFYAGAPLVGEHGYILGTLCVLDTVPRTLEPHQIKALQLLADEVMVHLELHRRRLQLKEKTQQQQQSASALEMLNRAIAMRNACSDALIRAKNEHDLLSSICDVAVKIGGYAMAWVGYAQYDAERRVKPAAFSGRPEDIDFLEERLISWSPFSPLGNGPAGYTIRECKPIHIKNLAESELFRPWVKSAVKRGFVDLITIPLRHESECLGIFALYRREPRDVSDDELALLQKLADDMVYGIMARRTEAERERIYGAVLRIAESVPTSDLDQYLQQLLVNMVSAVNAAGGFSARMNEDCSHLDVIRITPGGPPNRKTLAVPEPLQQQVCKVDGDAPEVLPALIQRFIRSELALDKNEVKIEVELAGEEYLFMGAYFTAPHNNNAFIDTTIKIFASKCVAELKRHRSERQIHEQAALLDKARDAIIVVDLERRIQFWNDGATYLYGWSKEEAVGQPVAMLLNETDTEILAHARQTLIQTGEWSGEIERRHKRGKLLMVESHCTLVRDEQGKPVSVMAIENDITERKRAERQIHRLAFYDTLTSLPNRQLLMARLQQVLSIELRHHNRGALFFLDLDNFKILNDTLGHDMGDMLLQKVASRLSACVRESDTVARFGGDEFVILLVDLSAEATEAVNQARTIAEMVLDKLNQPYFFGGKEHHSTPSIGITLFDDSGASVEDLLKQADLAMYQAKAKGRNRICFFDPQMQSTVSYHAKIESDIRIGLRQQQFVFHYQPQLSDERRVIGAEALARWQHPKHGLIPPKDFIPYAESSGLILSLSDQLIDTACRQVSIWSENPATAHIVLALNVSSKQLRQPDFVQVMKQAIQRHGTDPTKLKLEITESLLVENIDDTIGKMKELKALGVSFSLDDFGTGYSSLSYLKRLPLDQIKIDQSFIKDAAINEKDAAIARTIVALGENLGLDVIAEGVETVAQQEFLQDSNCRLYQGYLFSHAIPADEFERFVTQMLH
ncbi:sensor domain-containing phosphodiesterase [Novimethylophilus kurashikiensis]|nr:EAL domain-containing protein [Novimethylophilus kurashikiensis]